MPDTMYKRILLKISGEAKSARGTFFKSASLQEGIKKLKENGAVIVPEKFGEKKEVRFWPEKKRYYAFVHPKDTHGALWEVIDGKYASQL